jgi:hypothetical protein
MGYLILLLSILDYHLLCNVCNVFNPIQCNAMQFPDRNSLTISLTDAIYFHIVNGPVAIGGQDSSARWAHQPGEPDRDAKCVLPLTQTDQNEPFIGM